MFQIEMDNPGAYVVRINDKTIRCTSLNELLTVSKAFNIKLDEVENALVDLIHSDNDIAEFGVFGTFMYSKKRG